MTRKRPTGDKHAIPPDEAERNLNDYVEEETIKPKVGRNRHILAKKPKTGGRKKGTPNKTTAALKDAILTAAEEVNPGGKVAYLKWLAKNNSGAFASLLGKVLPTTLAGDPDNPVNLSINRIERVVVDTKLKP
jgi:hypothetical protein